MNQRVENFRQLKVAYTLQNVGSVDLRRELGDSVPVKYSLRGMAKRGHGITLIRLQNRQVNRYDDLTRLEQSEVLASGLPGNSIFRLFESIVRRIQGAIGLPYFAIFDSYRFYDAIRVVLPQFDLLHEHNGLFSIGSALACARLGKPYILTFSADPIMEMDLGDRPLRGLHRGAARKMALYTYRRADAILCVSKPAKRYLIEAWGIAGQKIHVMPNGVDTDHFRPDIVPNENQKGISQAGCPVLVFLGGFQPWHGVDLLIKSFARLQKDGKESRLLLIGDGPVRRQTEQQVEDLGLMDRVQFTGLVPQSQVPGLLVLADIAVIPYPKLHRELWFSPLKLYEYMASGRAILAADAGQISEVLVDGQTALLFPPGDVEAMTTGLSRLIDSPETRAELGANARRQAVEAHSWEKYTHNLEQIYFRVLSRDTKIH